MMKKYIIIFAAMLFVSSSAFAQKDTLNAVVQVENDYNPRVSKASKLSSTPQIEIQNNATPLDIIFSQRTHPFKKFIGERNVKESMPELQKQLPGYARLGVGTNNNIDAKAVYSIKPTKRDFIEMQGSFGGYSTSLEGVNREWDSRFFSTNVAARYLHRFAPLSLGVEATLKNNVFNYQTGNFFVGQTDKQNSLSLGLRTNIVSHSTGAVLYKAYAEYNVNTRNESATENRISENVISVGGNVEYQFDGFNFQKLVADISVDGYIYNATMRPDFGNKYKNFASINLNPYYMFNYQGWNVRLGANVNMLTAGGAAFCLSPNLSVEGAVNNHLTLFASAIGGRRINGLATLEELSPYWIYVAGDAHYTPTHNIADMSAGTRFAFAPFSGGIVAGFSFTKDDLMPCLSTDGIIGTKFAQAISRNFYLSGNIGYDYGGWLKFAADARYNHWGCTGSDEYLLYKPMVEVGAKVEARLYDGLYATIGYKFTGYTEVKGERNEEMNLLNARVNYKFHKQMAAYVQGNNLLGSKHQLFPGCEAQSASVVAGISVNF